MRKLSGDLILNYSKPDSEFTLDFVDMPSELAGYISYGQGVLNDFNSAGSYETNLKHVTDLFFRAVSEHLVGSVYVPTTRFITKVGAEPPHFTTFNMPGQTITYGSIIGQLAEMDRPPMEKISLRENFRELENFLAYCLEKSTVRIQIPDNKQTIHIDVDGFERRIEDLGTGVEQLLILGLASFGFPGKLVLIDEPELHFHPRAQKRMIKYLDKNVDTNFVFATHSAAVLDAITADVLQITHDGSKSLVRTITSSSDKYMAVRDLGHSPSELLQTRFAIWVEGPSDRIYLNHWIGKITSELKEGIDYSILFYGGKILSHHSFIDEESELVKAVSLARAFAVVMDSDRNPKKPNINRTKARVQTEIEKQGGVCWITEGREIENYLSIAVIEKIKADFPGTLIPQTKLDQVLDPEKVKKNEFARAAVSVENDEWPFDLRRRVTELVEAINAAR
jgi:ABC-type multidrug transport system ATPase subunit